MMFASRPGQKAPVMSRLFGWAARRARSARGESGRVSGRRTSRCHLSRWGRLGRGYSGTDDSTRMVVVFGLRAVAGWWRVAGEWWPVVADKYVLRKVKYSEI